MDDVTKNNMADIAGRQTAALHALTNNLRCELRRRNVFQRTSEFANRGAYRAENDNFSIFHLSAPFIVEPSVPATWARAPTESWHVASRRKIENAGKARSGRSRQGRALQSTSL